MKKENQTSAISPALLATLILGVPTAAGTALGGGLGATTGLVRGKSGRRVKDIIRGGLSGAATGGGAVLGAGLGVPAGLMGTTALGTYLTEKFPDLFRLYPNLANVLTASGVLGGAGLGAYLGGRTSRGLANYIMGLNPPAKAAQDFSFGETITRPPISLGAEFPSLLSRLRSGAARPFIAAGKGAIKHRGLLGLLAGLGAGGAGLLASQKKQQEGLTSAHRKLLLSALLAAGAGGLAGWGLGRLGRSKAKSNIDTKQLQQLIGQLEQYS